MVNIQFGGIYIRFGHIFRQLQTAESDITRNLRKTSVSGSAVTPVFSARFLFIVDKKRTEWLTLFQQSYEKVEICKNTVAIPFPLCYNHSGF